MIGMIMVKCVDKFWDGLGKICGYRLMDCYGNTQDMFAETLKEEIKNNNISVINLISVLHKYWYLLQ